MYLSRFNKKFHPVINVEDNVILIYKHFKEALTNMFYLEEVSFKL